MLKILRRAYWWHWLLLLVVSVGAMGPVHARCLTTIAPGDNVRSKMDQALAAGCSVYFQPGLHTTTDRLGYNFVGTAADPIIIYGDSSATTKLLRPNAAQNIMDLSGSYFVVRGLELQGGSRGLRMEGSVSNATFTDLIIHDTEDGTFSANSSGQTYLNLHISNSEFYNTSGFGECMYLGCNSNACTMGNSVVEYNYCHDTSSTQGAGQGDGIDLKGGAFNVVIRHNVFRDIFGPGILTYANAGGAQNIIEGNVILNPGVVGIQFTGDTVVRNNVIIMNLGADSVGINGSASNQGTPNNVQIINNTVINTTGAAGNDCLAVRGWGGGANNMVIANNALYCQGGTAFFMAAGTFANATVVANAATGAISNVPAGTFAGAVAVDQFEDIGNANLYPVLGSVLLGSGDPSQSPPDEFNCFIRDTVSADVGAYDYTSPGNPGWTAADTFKSCVGIVELFADGFEF